MPKIAETAGDSLVVVEDDDDWSEMIRLWLKTNNYEDVRFAISVKEGLKLIKSRIPDCVIMDLNLSDGDGHSLSRKLREKPETAKVPIIMITSFAGEKVNALRAGVDYFIEKTPNGTELLATLEALFRRRDLDADLLRYGDLAMRKDRGHVFLDGKFAAQLTPKTFSLLHLLVVRGPTPVPREELFALIDNREEAVLSRALDILVNRLRKSLPPALRKRLKVVRSFGYAYIPSGA